MGEHRREPIQAHLVDIDAAARAAAEAAKRERRRRNEPPRGVTTRGA